MAYNINGVAHTVDCDPNMPLLWALRDVVGLTGTKYGCGIEVCGACTVWIDGSPEKSCDKKASEGVGVKITTIEGLAATPAGAALQQAFVDLQVPQCGYCQSGMLMVATRLVSASSTPTDASISSAIGNICACGTYPRVRDAIKLASTRLKTPGTTAPPTTATTAKPTTTTTTAKPPATASPSPTTTTTKPPVTAPPPTTTTTRPPTITTTRPPTTTTTTRPKTTTTTVDR